MPRRSTLWSGDPRVKPPFGSVEVDWAHPLATGLVFASLLNDGGGGGQDLAFRFRGALLGSSPPVWTTTSRGIALKGMSSTVDNGIDYGAIPSTVDLFKGLNTFAFLLTPAQARYNNILTRVTGGGVGWRIGDINGNGWVGIEVNVGSLQVAKTAPPTGQPTVVMFTLNGSNTLASDVQIYYNGVVQAHTYDNNSSGHGELSDAAASLKLMTKASNLAESMLDSTLGFFYAWKGRRLTATESLWQSTEPYAFLRPILRRRTFVPIGVGPTRIGEGAAVAMAQTGAGIGVLVSEGRR